jgi:hypothetical protein
MNDVPNCRRRGRGIARQEGLTGKVRGRNFEGEKMKRRGRGERRAQFKIAQ